MSLLVATVRQRFPRLRPAHEGPIRPVELFDASAEDIPAVCAALCSDFRFVSLLAEATDDGVDLLYLLRSRTQPGWLGLRARVPKDVNQVPTTATLLPAADWHEREVEDLFGVVFSGHPRLGDFVLHDQRWREQLMPMLPEAAIATQDARPPSPRLWSPKRVLQAAGAFTMPVGPVYSASAESALFLLETLGEDVRRALPRLFYKFRAIEKIVEGQAVENALLRVERASGTSAVAHAWAFVQAIERICGVEVSRETELLRSFFAELERYRHHTTAIREVCESTSTLVATSQASLIEEEVLRLSGSLAGHRYLFGAIVPGGCSICPDRDTLEGAVGKLRDIDARLRELGEQLRYSSSFLDRIEEVGTISPTLADAHGLVGPVARASNQQDDLRSSQPYGGYADLDFEVPVQAEGDGYARLRVLFEEAHQSRRLLEQLASARPQAPAIDLVLQSGGAIGWAETPRGAAACFVRLRDDGNIGRLHLRTASFANWHGFRLAAEEFAFQDFPIILATMDLSVAENDR
jgi:formate hydrogenlyase subunit 5